LRAGDTALVGDDQISERVRAGVHRDGVDCGAAGEQRDGLGGAAVIRQGETYQGFFVL